MNDKNTNLYEFQKMNGAGNTFLFHDSRNHKLNINNGSTKLILLEDEYGISPGQACVFYSKDENGFNSDFLSVINTDPNDRAYGSLIATLPVGFNNINAHHSEHRFHSSKQLFANGFSGGRSFIFDLKDPTIPKLKTNFTNINEFTFPHSFERLPNGNVLATFQTLSLIHI